MKNNQKAIIIFKTYSDENLAVLAGTVHAAMQVNPFFEDSNLDLTELEDAIEDFEEKLSISRRKGSPYDTALKNDSRVQLVQALEGIVFIVNKVANGNLTILLSSGLPISNYRSSILPPKIIEGLKLKDGHQPGQMLLSFNRQDNIRVYQYRYSKEKNEEGEIQWSDPIYTTRSMNNLIEPVVPGAIYYVSVRARNSKGISVWSDYITWMAR